MDLNNKKRMEIMTKKILMNKQKLHEFVKKTVTKTLNEITAFHGTNASFDEFDLAFVNTGAKQQAYGYGIYLSLLEKGSSIYGKNLLTVEIPSEKNKYLYGEKIYKKTLLNKVKLKMFRHLLKVDDSYHGSERELMQDLNEAFEPCNGLTLSGTIETYLGSDREASKFLYSMGFIGLRYKTNDFENVVMFNPKDIKIIKKNI